MVKWKLKSSINSLVVARCWPISCAFSLSLSGTRKFWMRCTVFVVTVAMHTFANKYLYVLYITSSYSNGIGGVGGGVWRRLCLAAAKYVRTIIRTHPNNLSIVRADVHQAAGSYQRHCHHHHGAHLDWQPPSYMKAVLRSCAWCISIPSAVAAVTSGYIT